MTWGEAVRQARLLRLDPSTQIAAAMEGWDYPFSRELAATADLWDLEHAKAGPKKPARYPRPMPEAQAMDHRQRGNAAGRTPDEVKAILREHFGHAKGPV